MASPFSNKFFSIAGQKERLNNVVQTLSVAVTGKDTSGQKASVVANTGSETANAILSTAANHPFITAGVAATAVTAAGLGATAGAAGSSSAGAATAATSTAGAATGVGLKTLAIVGGAGLLAGSLFNSGGKASTGAQTTTPSQIPSINPNPNQNTNQNPQTNPFQTSNNPFDVSGSNNKIDYNYRQSQDTTSNYTGYATPVQDTPSYLTATQDTSPQQTATTSTGTNWLLTAGIIVGAYYLTNKR